MTDKVATVAENVDCEEKYPADLDHALAVAGIGRYNIMFCLILAMFLIAAIVEPVGYSYLLPAAACDLQISDTARGFIASVPYIGIVITSFPWGYLIDTKGRKKIIILASLAAGGFSILSSFMPEIISFTICKFLTSLCLSCPAAIPYTFIGEILPQKYRDLTLSVTNALQIMGSALVPLFAWAILPLDFRIDFGLYEFRPWRLLNIIYSSIFIIAAVLMSFGPESPKFLMSQGKHDEALKVLQRIYAGNKGKSREDYPVKCLKSVDNARQKTGLLSSLKVQTVPLLRPPYLKWLCLNGFLLFGIFSSLNGLNLWVPDVLNRVMTGPGDAERTACQVIAQRLNETVENAECIDTIEEITFTINTIANVSCAVIAVVVSSTVKFIGKKSLLILVYFLIGSFCISINFITEAYVFAVLLSTLPLLGLGIGPVNAFAVQIFPTHLRGMAVSLSMMLGRIGSVFGTNVAGILLNAACEFAFYLFGGLLIVCGLFAFLLPNAKKPPTNKLVQIDTTRL